MTYLDQNRSNPNGRNRRNPVIAGCSGEGRLTTAKPGGAAVNHFAQAVGRSR